MVALIVVIGAPLDFHAAEIEGFVAFFGASWCPDEWVSICGGDANEEATAMHGDKRAFREILCPKFVEWLKVTVDRIGAVPLIDAIATTNKKILPMPIAAKFVEGKSDNQLDMSFTFASAEGQKLIKTYVAYKSLFTVEAASSLEVVVWKGSFKLWLVIVCNAGVVWETVVRAHQFEQLSLADIGDDISIAVLAWQKAKHAYDALAAVMKSLPGGPGVVQVGGGAGHLRALSSPCDVPSLCAIGGASLGIGLQLTLFSLRWPLGLNIPGLFPVLSGVGHHPVPIVRAVGATHKWRSGNAQPLSIILTTFRRSLAAGC